MGQLSIVVFSVAIGYFLFDLFSGVTGASPYQVGCAMLAAVSFALNRYGYHTAAKILLALTTNITVYIFATSEKGTTDVHIFFIAIAIATIAVFGYEQRIYAIAFTGFTLALYVTEILFDYQIIKNLGTDATYFRDNQRINFITAIVASSLIVFGLVALNYHSEKAIRESEQQLARKNAELTRLNVELDRFVYSSSHDLTAPLRSILGLITLTNLTDDRDESKKYIGMIKDRVVELEKFIKEMSDYSKNASSVVMIENIDINKLLTDVLETLRYYPGADKLEIDINIPDDISVYSDHSRLKVILSNLVSNCFKYCDLDKKNPFVKIVAEINQGHLHLEIIDNGLGIHGDALPRIFDMFYRAHEQSDGSGLGLYIVKETIDKLGGTIDVKSIVKDGTTFRITLPAKVGN